MRYEYYKQTCEKRKYKEKKRNVRLKMETNICRFKKIVPFKGNSEGEDIWLKTNVEIVIIGNTRGIKLRVDFKQTFE